MNHPLFYTPTEAEALLKAKGVPSPSAEQIRAAAVDKPEHIGFPVCVMGTRVYIPKKSFDEFWGISRHGADLSDSDGGATCRCGKERSECS